MTCLNTRRARLLPAVLALLLVSIAAGCGNKASDSGGSNYPTRNLTLIAPADPGGGWDQTARAMQKAIEEAKLTNKNVEVRNIPGAGGTIGLSRLVSKYKGDASQLMLMGLVMIGAIERTSRPPT